LGSSGTADGLAAIAGTRPELLEEHAAAGAWARQTGLVVFGLAVALGLAALASPWGSRWPDGLTAVAVRLGFAQRAVATPVASGPLADYTMPGVRSPALATALAGAVGTVVMFGVAFALARRLTRAKKESPATSARQAHNKRGFGDD